MRAKPRIGILAIVSSSLLLSGCMGMGGMMMSAEQKQSTCDSYRSMMNSPSVTAEQRGQIISGMRQMGCPNIPSQ